MFGPVRFKSTIGDPKVLKYSYSLEAKQTKQKDVICAQQKSISFYVSRTRVR